MSSNYHFGQSTIEISDTQIAALASIPLTTIPYLSNIDQYLNTTGTPEFQKLGINQIAGSNQLEVNGTTILKGVTSITNTTQSNDTQSGCVVLSGGLAVQKNLTIGGSTTFSGGFANMNISNLNSTNITTGSIIVQNGATINNISTTSVSSGSLIVSNGTVSNLNATSLTCGSLLVSSGGLSVSGIIYSNNTTDSTDTSSGSLVIKGGVGISKALRVTNIATNYIESSRFTYSDQLKTVSLGYLSGTSDQASTYIGHYAGEFVNTGITNTLIGHSAGLNYFGASDMVAGSRNVLVGFATGVLDGSAINAVGIGYGVVSDSNKIVLGNAQHTTCIINATGVTELTGSLKIDGTTDSVGSSTGSVVISGGVGISGSTYIRGSLVVASETCGALLISSGSLTISGGNNTISLQNSNTGGTTVLSSLLAPNITVTNISSNMGKDTNAYGSIVNTYYADAVPANIKGTIGLYGRSESIQFDGNGNVGINSTPLPGINLSVGGTLNANDTTLRSLTVTGTTTGSLYVYNGSVFSSTMDSTSISSGAVIVSGGMGIRKNLRIGGSSVFTGPLLANGGTVIKTSLDTVPMNSLINNNAVNNLSFLAITIQYQGIYFISAAISYGNTSSNYYAYGIVSTNGVSLSTITTYFTNGIALSTNGMDVRATNNSGSTMTPMYFTVSRIAFPTVFGIY